MADGSLLPGKVTRFDRPVNAEVAGGSNTAVTVGQCVRPGDDAVRVGDAGDENGHTVSEPHSGQAASTDDADTCALAPRSWSDEKTCQILAAELALADRRLAAPNLNRAFT